MPRLPFLAALAAAALVAGCGGGDNEGPRGGTPARSGNVDSLDPGKTYYVYAIGIVNALHRGLYSSPPNETTEPVPDLAEAAPDISEDGKTVTVTLRRGVMFSDPVD